MIAALLDANVLSAPSVRDLLLWLAVEPLYHPRWTDAIHEEWMRNVLANHPHVDAARLARTRQKMDQVDPLSLVAGYEPLLPTLSLPDTGDRHVLAAAIHAKAPVIVTYNLSDFPVGTLSPFGIAALHPDTFTCRLFAEHPVRFLRAAARHRFKLQRPPKSVSEYLDTLRARGLTQLAAHLENHRQEL